MALLLQRNFQLTKLVRLLSFRSTQRNLSVRLTKVSTNRSHLEKLYSTAAVNYKVNYDGFENKSNLFKVASRNDQDIDEALEDIDIAVRRTGRTVIDRVQGLFQQIENVGFASETQSLYLLRCCGLLHLEPENKRIELVDKMWEKFKMLGVKLDIKHFNALLKVYLDCNNNFSPSDILISMEQNDVEPNQTTYSYLIEKYCRDGNMNGANEILEFLKEKNIPVNEYVFNSLIKGHLKLNDEDGARQVIEVMQNSNITPTSYTYTTLACCFANKGDLNKVDEVIGEAESMGIRMGVNNLLQILVSAAPSKETGFIDKLMQKMDNLYDWRQSFINCAAELVHKGFDSVAFKLIMAISSTEYGSATNNFMKVLIKEEVPVERVIKYATEIYDKGFNNFIFTNAAMISVEYGKIDHAVAFFNEMTDRGIPLRKRNFRPLFVANKHSVPSIWKIINAMGTFGVPLDFTTYEEYVLPFIVPGSPKEFLSKLEEHNQNVLSVIDPLFDYYCSKEEIEHAYYLIENYHVGVNKNFNLEHFLSFYNKFRSNPTSYFKVLKYVLENSGLIGQNVNVIRGKQLATFLQISPKIFELFHKSPVGQDCHYDGQSINICRRIIRENARADLLPYLRRIAIINEISVNRPLRKITVEEEDEIINSTETDTVKQEKLMDLLSIHLLNRDLDRATRVKSELDAYNIVLPPALYAKILFLQCEIDHIEEAKESFYKIKELYPHFKIDTHRLIDYARLLLKYSYTDESVNIIKNECQEIHNFSGSDMLLKSIRRYMNSIVQTGDVELAKTVQETLVNRPDFSELKEVFLESVIKICLHRGEIDSAVKAFENSVINFHCCPSQTFLMKRLIVRNDQSNLQMIVDLASKIEGKVKVLHKLALAFLDLDHSQQATKVFQSLNRDINYRFLEGIAQTYFSSNDVTALENLLYATFNLKSEKKESLYNLLISLYGKNNQYEKCCKILDLMKKENAKPSNECKQIINGICIRNQKSLLFPDVESSDSTVLSSIGSSADETVTFLNLLHEEKVEEALKNLKFMKKGYIRTIPFQDMTHLIELLIKDNCLNNLSSITPAMVYIIENASDIFKPLLEKYSEDGDVEAMVSLSNVFPDFSLKKCFFNRFLGQAYIKSNRQEDLLSELEARSQKKNKLFSITAMQELVKTPHLEERVVKLAKSYLKAEFDLPFGVVWAHYFLSEQFEKSHELSQIGKIPFEKIDSIILKHVQQTENVEIGKKYAEFIGGQDCKDRSKERAYGIVLDLLVLKNMNDEAVDLIKNAKSKNVHLEKYYQSTLTTLKSSLERENKPVPFSVNVGEVLN